MRNILLGFGAGCAIVTAAVVLLGIANAQVVATDTTIRACVANLNGVVRIVGGTAACRSTETLMTWNAAGQPGPKGDKGDKGDTGDSHGAMRLVAQETVPGVGDRSTSLFQTSTCREFLAMVATPGSLDNRSQDQGQPIYTSADGVTKLLAEPRGAWPPNRQTLRFEGAYPYVAIPISGNGDVNVSLYCR